jgi:hypothetical protein
MTNWPGLGGALSTGWTATAVDLPTVRSHTPGSIVQLGGHRRGTLLRCDVGAAEQRITHRQGTPPAGSRDL